MNVIIGTPSYDGKIDVNYVDSLLHTVNKASALNIQVHPLFICYDALIQRARNDIFKIAYDAKVDALVFIDSDIGWNPDDFFKLLQYPHDLIGGSYRKKTDDSEMYVIKALENSQTPINIDSNGIMEVSGLGCGFLKLSRSCIEQLWNTSKPYISEKGNSRMVFEVVCENNDIISEDITMCNKWRSLGNRVYLDTNITCNHIGNKNFMGNVNIWLNRIKSSTTQVEKLDSVLKPYFEPTDIKLDDSFKILT